MASRVVRNLLSLAAVSVPLFFSACAKRDRAEHQVLRISQRNEPATLDPQLATLPDEFFVIRALSEGLVTPNPAGGVPVPAAATSWASSDDGLTWTFHLRPGAQWSNGEPVTSADFVASIRRMLTPATAAPKAPLFYPLKNARAFLEGTVKDFAAVGVAGPDAHTLVFTLEQPTPDFLALVASGPWIPVRVATVDEHGRDWTQPKNHVGNGRFTLEGWSPNERLVVRRNPRHWGTPPGPLTAIEFLAFDSGDTEERAFRAGQVDVTLAVPAAKLDTYRSAQPPVLHTLPLHETRYLAVNTQRGPLRDARVRQALSLALNRTLLVEKVLKGGQQPALTYVPPGLGGYAPRMQLHEDAAEARRLLAEAGFPGGRGFPKFELSTWGASTAQLEAVQQWWRDQLGIEVTIAQREARAHLAALVAGDYDVGFVTAIPDYDSATDLLARLTTGDATNYAHWSDPEYDRLVRGNPADLAAAESRLLTELPVIPLYFNTKNFLLRPTVRGWQEDALWTRFYAHVSLDEP